MNIFETLQKEGITIQVPGNKPLNLNQKNKLWFIEQGEVDIFTTFINKKEEVVTQRYHVTHLLSFNIILNVYNDKFKNNLQWIATGNPQTRLIEYDLEKFIKLARQKKHFQTICHLMDTWFVNLINTIKNQIPTPSIYKNLDQFNGKEDTIYKATEKLVWIQVLKGDSLFLGKPAWPIPKKEWIPMSTNAWIKTTQETTLQIEKTANLLTTDQLPSILNNFNKILSQFLEKRIQEKWIEEKTRINQTYEVNKLSLTKALFRLSSIMNLKKLLISPKEYKESLLFRTAKMVGLASEITLVNTNQVQLSEEKNLEQIMMDSNIKMRTVLLEHKWWETEHGHLLVFQKKDKTPLAAIQKSDATYLLYNLKNNTVQKINENQAENMDPIAYMFYKPFPNKEISLPELIKFGLSGSKKDIFNITILGLGAAILGFLLPLVMSSVLDTVIPDSNTAYLWDLISLLGCLAIGIFIFQIVKSLALVRIKGRMDWLLQSALWDRLVSLPATFFHKYTTGDLARRGMGIVLIKEILSDVIVNTILTFIFSLFYLILLTYFSLELTLVFFGTNILICMIIFFFLKKQMKYKREIKNLEGENLGFTLQMVIGIAKLKISGTENRVFNEWSRTFSQKKKMAYQEGRLRIASQTILSGFPNFILMVLMLWIMNRNPDLSVGNYMGILSIITMFQMALMQLIYALTAVIEIKPLYERMTDILKTVPEIDSHKESTPSLSGKIEVSHVHFRYNESAPPILKDVSLEINPGEFVALVGESGSGKSTLFRLLVGFEAPVSGTIYFDEKDLSNLDIRSVRRQTGVVLQNSKLMPGTILSNILGTTNLTIDNAWEVAKMVGLAEDVKQMPMGMYTLVGEEGGGLSGGQRQRILIARALITKPQILFFDEATSALDNQTQALVTASLNQLQTTRIVIAHRLSTIMQADRIYVLHKGEIIQTGTYEKLSQEEGFFKELAKRQIA